MTISDSNVRYVHLIELNMKYKQDPTPSPPTDTGETTSICCSLTCTILQVVILFDLITELLSICNNNIVPVIFRLCVLVQYNQVLSFTIKSTEYFMKRVHLHLSVNDSLSLPDESWRSGSGEEQPLSGLLGLSLLCFLFGTVTYTHTHAQIHT